MALFEDIEIIPDGTGPTQGQPIQHTPNLREGAYLSEGGPVESEAPEIPYGPPSTNVGGSFKITPPPPRVAGESEVPDDFEIDYNTPVTTTVKKHQRVTRGSAARKQQTKMPWNDPRIPKEAQQAFNTLHFANEAMLGPAKVVDKHIKSVKRQLDAEGRANAPARPAAFLGDIPPTNAEVDAQNRQQTMAQQMGLKPTVTEKLAEATRRGAKSVRASTPAEKLEDERVRQELGVQGVLGTGGYNAVVGGPAMFTEQFAKSAEGFLRGIGADDSANTIRGAVDRWHRIQSGVEQMGPYQSLADVLASVPVAAALNYATFKGMKYTTTMGATLGATQAAADTNNPVKIFTGGVTGAAKMIGAKGAAALPNNLLRVLGGAASQVVPSTAQRAMMGQPTTLPQAAEEALFGGAFAYRGGASRAPVEEPIQGTETFRPSQTATGFAPGANVEAPYAQTIKGLFGEPGQPPPPGGARANFPPSPGGPKEGEWSTQGGPGTEDWHSTKDINRNYKRESNDTHRNFMIDMMSRMLKFHGDGFVDVHGVTFVRQGKDLHIFEPGETPDISYRNVDTGEIYNPGGISGEGQTRPVPQQLGQGEPGGAMTLRRTNTVGMSPEAFDAFGVSPFQTGEETSYAPYAQGLERNTIADRIKQGKLRKSIGESLGNLEPGSLASMPAGWEIGESSSPTVKRSPKRRAQLAQLTERLRQRDTQQAQPVVQELSNYPIQGNEMAEQFKAQSDEALAQAMTDMGGDPEIVGGNKDLMTRWLVREFTNRLGGNNETQTQTPGIKSAAQDMFEQQVNDMAEANNLAVSVPNRLGISLSEAKIALKRLHDIGETAHRESRFFTPEESTEADKLRSIFYNDNDTLKLPKRVFDKLKLSLFTEDKRKGKGVRDLSEQQTPIPPDADIETLTAIETLRNLQRLAPATKQALFPETGGVTPDDYTPDQTSQPSSLMDFAGPKLDELKKKGLALKGLSEERTPSVDREANLKSFAAPADPRLKQETGVPIDLYHGTQSPSEITALDPSKLDPNALYGPGFYMTQDPEIATGYTETKVPPVGQGEEATEYLRTRIRDFRNEDPFLTVPQDPFDNIREARRWINDHPFLSEDSKVKLMLELRDMERQPAPHVYKFHTNISKPFDIDAPITESDVEAFDKAAETWLGEDAYKLRNLFSVQKSINQATNGRDVYEAFKFAGMDKAEINEMLQEMGYDGITHIGGTTRVFDTEVEARAEANRVGANAFPLNNRIQGLPSTQWAVDGHRVWIAFPNASVKSATGNKGTYDPSIDNLSEERGYQPGDLLSQFESQSQYTTSFPGGPTKPGILEAPGALFRAISTAVAGPKKNPATALAFPAGKRDIDNVIKEILPYIPENFSVKDLVDELYKMSDQSLERGWPTFNVVQRGIGPERILSSAQHETIHMGQYAALAKGQRHPVELHDPSWAASNDLVLKANEHPFADSITLGREKYNRIDYVAHELAAYTAQGNGHFFGLTPGESLFYFDQYVQHILDHQGPEGVEKFMEPVIASEDVEGVFRNIRRQIENARSQLVTTGELPSIPTLIGEGKSPDTNAFRTLPSLSEVRSPTGAGSGGNPPPRGPNNRPGTSPAGATPPGGGGPVGGQGGPPQPPPPPGSNLLVLRPNSGMRPKLRDLEIAIQTAEKTILGRDWFQRLGHAAQGIVLTGLKTTFANAQGAGAQIPVRMLGHGMGGAMSYFNQTAGSQRPLPERINEAWTEGMKGAAGAMQVIMKLNPKVVENLLVKMGADPFISSQAQIAAMKAAYPQMEARFSGAAQQGPGSLALGQQSLADAQALEQLLPNYPTEPKKQAKRDALVKRMHILDARNKANQGLAGKAWRGVETVTDKLLFAFKALNNLIKAPYFMGELINQSWQQGIDFPKALQTGTMEKVPKEVLEEAYRRAQEVMLERMPRENQPDKLGEPVQTIERHIEHGAARIITGLSNLGYPGFLLTGFPKVAYEGARVLYEVMPLGFIAPGSKFAAKTAFKKPGQEGWNRKDFESIGLATVGTFALIMAGLIRKQFGGPKYNQIKTGATDKQNKPIYTEIPDNSNYAPYLWIADMAERSQSGTMPDSKEISRDFSRLFMGLQKTDVDSPFSILGHTANYWGNGGSWEDMPRSAKLAIGQIPAMWLTPFTNVRDLAASIVPEENFRRDTRGHELLGPSVDKIPFLRSKILPRLTSPTQGEVSMGPVPVLTQVPGINIKPGQNPAGEELAKLGININDYLKPDSDPIIQAAQNKKMYDILVAHGEVQVMNKESYKTGSPTLRRAMWKEALSEMAPFAKAAGLEANPTEAKRRQALRSENPDRRKVSGLQEKIERDFPRK